MTAYALELIRKHDARMAAGKSQMVSLITLRDKIRKTEEHIRKVGERLRDSQDHIDLLPLMIPKEEPRKPEKPAEMATPDIIAFNSNLLEM